MSTLILKGKTADRTFTIRSSDDEKTVYHQKIDGLTPQYWPTLTVRKTTSNYNAVHSQRYTLKVPHVSVSAEGVVTQLGYCNSSDNISMSTNVPEGEREEFLALASSLREYDDVETQMSKAPMADLVTGTNL